MKTHEQLKEALVKGLVKFEYFKANGERVEAVGTCKTALIAPLTDHDQLTKDLQTLEEAWQAAQKVRSDDAFIAYLSEAFEEVFGISSTVEKTKGRVSNVVNYYDIRKKGWRSISFSTSFTVIESLTL